MSLVTLCLGRVACLVDIGRPRQACLYWNALSSPTSQQKARPIYGWRLSSISNQKGLDYQELFYLQNVVMWLEVFHWQINLKCWTLFSWMKASRNLVFFLKVMKGVFFNYDMFYLHFGCILKPKTLCLHALVIGWGMACQITSPINNKLGCFWE